MPIFFHGWRRKSGMAALIISCTFMAGWIRSYEVTDDLDLCSVAFVSSMDRHILLERWLPPSSESTEFGMPEWIVDEYIEIDALLDDKTIEWRFRCLGLAIGETRLSDRDHDRMFHCIIPYWMIVLPLTLLSAYLLLINPRSSQTRESTKQLQESQVTHA